MSIEIILPSIVVRFATCINIWKRFQEKKKQSEEILPNLSYPGAKKKKKKKRDILGKLLPIISGFAISRKLPILGYEPHGR